MYAVPWLRRLLVKLSRRRPGFDPRPVHVRFMVNKVALGQASLRLLLFSLVSVIPTVLKTHLHLNTTLFWKTNGRNLGAFKQRNVSFRYQGSRRYKSTFAFLEYDTVALIHMYQRFGGTSLLPWWLCRCILRNVATYRSKYTSPLLATLPSSYTKWQLTERSRTLLQKLKVTQTFKTFLASYGHRRFISASEKARTRSRRPKDVHHAACLTAVRRATSISRTHTRFPPCTSKLPENLMTTEDTSCLWQTPKGHFLVHNKPSPGPILNQTQSHTLYPISSTLILILSYYNA